MQLRRSFGGKEKVWRAGGQRNRGSQKIPGPRAVGEGGWLSCEVGWESTENGCQLGQGEDTSGERGKRF